MYRVPLPGYVMSLDGGDQLDSPIPITSSGAWFDLRPPAQISPTPEVPLLASTLHRSPNQEPSMQGFSTTGFSPRRGSPLGASARASSCGSSHNGPPFQGPPPRASPPGGISGRGPPPGGPPRGGYPSRWYPPSPNMRPPVPCPPLEYGRRSRLRDQPVTVVLEKGGVYLCNRADILQHLPNTRQHPFGRTLCPNIGPENETDSALDALHYIFRGLETYRMTSTPLYLFERAQAFLYRDSEASYQSAFDFFLGVCAALDSEHGLGCSDELLRQIDDFATDLMDAHELDFFNRADNLMVFFISYSKVFQPTTPRHLDTLRTLYNSIPVFHRARLMEGIGRALQNNPRRSNVHAMFRAMRDMGMA